MAASQIVMTQKISEILGKVAEQLFNERNDIAVIERNYLGASLDELSQDIEKIVQQYNHSALGGESLWLEQDELQQFSTESNLRQTLQKYCRWRETCYQLNSPERELFTSLSSLIRGRHLYDIVMQGSQKHSLAI